MLPSSGSMRFCRANSRSSLLSMCMTVRSDGRPCADSAGYHRPMGGQGTTVGVDSVPAIVSKGLSETLQASGFSVEPVLGDPLAWLDAGLDRLLLLGGFDFWEQGVVEGPVIAVVESMDPIEVAHRIRAGAIGVISYDVSDPALVAAVQLASVGQTVVPLSWLQELASHWADTAGPEIDSSDMDLPRRIAEGATVVQLAHEIHFSERAVHSRLAALYRRLAVSNRSQAIALASRRGWLG